MPGDQANGCFIDTNIWLYAFVESGEPAKSVTARALIGDTQPVVSTQVINEEPRRLIKAHGDEVHYNGRYQGMVWRWSRQKHTTTGPATR